MEAYTGFAGVYDMFMDNIPYKEWGEYLCGLLQEYQITEGVVVDMGCGTGKITEHLALAGYDMIGIDNSQEMLSIAAEKKCRYQEEDARSQILYLLQDMREMELYGKAKAMVSICDSMNYILEEEELLDIFCLVNEYLEKDGVFIFDMNTLYKYEEILGEQTIAENREDAAFIWENFYYPKQQINEYDLTIFVKEGEELYHRFCETHYQRGYSLETVRKLLETAGLEFVTAYDAFTRDAPRPDSERIYMIAGKK